MVKLLYLLMVCFSLPVWAGSDIKDPTQPYQLQAGGAAVSVRTVDYQVTSILKRKNMAWAIVNGIKVSVDGRIGSATVLQIAYDKVLLDIGANQRWVPLSNNSGLKKSR